MSLHELLPAPIARPGMRISSETAFGCPRDFLENDLVYVVISPRARGLSIGLNLNPDKHCNFACAYCEVSRSTSGQIQTLDLDCLVRELQQTLGLVQSGALRERDWYRLLPPELLCLRHVALSGDGEPTLCPQIAEVIQAVVHLRALAAFPFFKLVLITNATGLDLPAVRMALGHFTSRDEIWAKLDAGSQAYMEQVNQPQVPLDRVIENILELGRQRPVIIQSLFPSLAGKGPSGAEIDQYAHRLLDLKNRGAQISLVQIYSATRPTPHSECGHLPLKTLSGIARTVRETTGLRAEVF